MNQTEKENLSSKNQSPIIIPEKEAPEPVWYTNLDSALLQRDEVAYLSLADDGLKSFPMDILELRGLVKLDLAMNEITKIPYEIYKLENLEELNFAYGYIDSIPPSIGMLKRLKFLQLLENEVKYLPPEIGNAISLETINLTLNPVHDLPLSISRLKKLKYLSFPPPLLQEQKVPKEKIERLVELLPSCRLIYAN